MQAVNITTNIKVKVDFTLPTLSTTNFVYWKSSVDDSDKGRYDIILGRYLLIKLGLNLKLSEHIIEDYDGPFKVYKTSMVYFGMYIFKYLNTS